MEHSRFRGYLCSPLRKTPSPTADGSADCEVRHLLADHEDLRRSLLESAETNSVRGLSAEAGDQLASSYATLRLQINEGLDALRVQSGFTIGDVISPLDTMPEGSSVAF